ncbi:MAG: EpsI family protein [Burkholderiaceae bacterium]
MAAADPLTRRAAVAGLAMAATAWLGHALVPRRRMADRRAAFKLEDAVPRQFAGWSWDPRGGGVVVNPQTEALLKRLYTETLERTYARGPGERVMLSIAYGADQSDVSLQMHYPEVCYPAQGFQLVSERTDRLDLAPGQIPVRRLVTQYGQIRHEPVTYWTVIGDHLTLGVLDKRLTEIRHGLQGEIVDGMLVRISSISRDDHSAFSLQDQFARDLVAALSPAARARLAPLR